MSQDTPGRDKHRPWRAGLERAFGLSQWVGWRAALALLLFAATQSVWAQDTAATDAERIAQMRDRVDQTQQDVDVIQTPVEGTAQTDGANPQTPVQDEDADKYAGNDGIALGQSEGGLFNKTPGGTGTGGVGDNWLMSTLAALGVVIAMVFGLRWLLRRGGVATASAPRGSVVEVLSRTTVAPRSHVVLMRVGQRILIVNDSPNGMRTLGTVHEPEEVADLLGAIEADRPTSVSKNFSGVMSRLAGGWSGSELETDEVESADMIEDGVAFNQTRDAVSSVRGRLEALAGVGGTAGAASGGGGIKA